MRITGPTEHGARESASGREKQVRHCCRMPIDRFTFSYGQGINPRRSSYKVTSPLNCNLRFSCRAAVRTAVAAVQYRVAPVAAPGQRFQRNYQETEMGSHAERDPSARRHPHAIHISPLTRRPGRGWRHRRTRKRWAWFLPDAQYRCVVSAVK
jgi:hypothetical protein